MAEPPKRYKSELYIPITKDTQTFEERQKNIWGDMHERMARRRQEWDDEVARMRHDFFRLKPASEKRRGSSENLLESRNLGDIFLDDPKASGGGKRFCVGFDVREFGPDEISVTTDEQKLLVNARHEEGGDGRTLTRQFSRTIDIPTHVDPATLQCTLSNDGILQVEAAVPVPQYDKIQRSVADGQTMSSTTTGSGPMVTQKDESRTFKISVDVGTDYDPQDVCVRTVNRKLVVSARHETQQPGRKCFREFCREFDLPADVDPNLVSAAMTEDGQLLVEAPLSSYSQGSYVGRDGSTKQPKVMITLTPK